MAASAPVTRLEMMPIPRTRLIGRVAKITAARALLLQDAVPLLTLIGPGGVGKTRLALAIAQDLAEHFADGVVWIDLAPLAEATLVPATVAAALALPLASDQPVLEQLTRALRPRQTLLLLDNCEHVLVETAQLVGTLLAGCPAAQVMATSRAPLQIRGEQLLPVEPLPLPPIDAPMEAIAEAEAVRLFAARARAVRPGFQVEPANAATLALLCRHLDGLPLALELAAAHSAVLSPAALLAQMTDRLRLLTGGARDLPQRQRTMHDTIAWSYDRLTEEEQGAFRQLAVFTGGWTLEAAAAVLVREDLETLALLEHLVAQSLVVRPLGPEERTARFTMLETIRHYGLEVLAEGPEHDTTRDAHAAYFLSLAEGAEGQLFGGPDQPRWHALLEAEHDNFRAAFDWFEDRGDVERCLRLAGALWVLWEAQGQCREGRDRLRRALRGSDGTSEVLCMAAMRGLAAMELCLGNTKEVTRLVEETLPIDRHLGDKGGVAHAHYLLGLVAWAGGDLDSAAARPEEALALYEDIHDLGGCLWCHRRPWCAQAQTALLMGQVGAVTSQRGDDDRAKPLLERALILLREMGDQVGIAIVLRHLGAAAEREGDADQAAAFLTEALALYRELGVPQSIAETLLALGDVLRRSDAGSRSVKLDRATVYLTEALTHFRTRQDHRGVGSALLALGACARDQGDHECAVALAEEALQLSRQFGDKGGITEALNALGDGRRAVADGVAVVDRLTTRTAPASSPALLGRTEERTAFDLTRREREILALLCQRQTDHEIAATLFISPKTTGHHVSNILGKLGAANRRDAAAIAVRSALV